MITTYVINLDEDTEKMEKLRQVFPWELTRVPAGRKKSACPLFSNKLVYGCLLSHRKVWRMVESSGSPALILEDDCQPVVGFEAEFPRLMRTLPSDYDVALFGYTASDVAGDHLITAAVAPVMKRRPMRKVNEDWFVPGIFIGAHCYLVSPHGAKKLLDDKTIFHADAVMCRNTNLNLYCARQPIAMQHTNGFVRYNNQLSWEWIMKEPLVALGDSTTIRVKHVVILYVVIILVLAASKKPIVRVLSRLLVVLPIVHYINIRAHIKHNMRYLPKKDSRQTEERIEMLQKLNDSLNCATIVILVAVSAFKGVLIPMVDLYLLGQLIRALIILAYRPLPDPSGTCEERSLRRYSVFENCGTLRVSGHIMGAVFLSYLVPNVGLPLIVLQAALILSSKSHYPADIVLGIVVASTLLWLSRKINYLPSKTKKKKQKLF